MTSWLQEASELSRIIISDTVDKGKSRNGSKRPQSTLNTEKAFLLTDNGFELDYMDIHYECPLCKDTGMLETGEKCQCFGEVSRTKIESVHAGVEPAGDSGQQPGYCKACSTGGAGGSSAGAPQQPGRS